MPPQVLRKIPSVNELLDSPPLQLLVKRANRSLVVSGVRSFLENLRNEAQTAATDVHFPTATELAQRIADWIDADQQPTLRPVVNATGILLHTGLGRAPLADEAITEITSIADSYASVEIDLETGERCQRTVAVEKLIRDLTGAEAAIVVNNNAGATMLTLAALANDQDVIVSRGELIEIGGSYRLPEVMTACGARLCEVGSTNKTRIADYESAITEQTGVLLKVHTSNYVIMGFTEETSVRDLVVLGRHHDLPVVHDIGSGALFDLAPFGISDEPVARDSIAAGADVILFSGDKLLGGPQCGIIAGRLEFIATILKHPMTRALRVDKLTLSALAATLRLYQDPDRRQTTVPLLRLLSTSLDNLQNRAERLAIQLAAFPWVSEAKAVSEEAYLGGGSVPTQQLASWCVSLEIQPNGVSDLARRLRIGCPAVVGRVQRNQLLLDLRAVFPQQDMLIVEAFEKIGSTGNDNSDSKEQHGHIDED